MGGDGSRAFRTGAAPDRTGWLDIGQVAEKATIMSAMKVKSQENRRDCWSWAWLIIIMTICHPPMQ